MSGLRDNAEIIILRTIRSIAVGIAVAACITLFANTVSFLGTLNQRYPFLILLLPLGAYLTLRIYQKLGDAYRKTTVSAIDTIHDMEHAATDGIRITRGRISPWMGPVAYIAASISHLTGASVGKEGVGIQIGLSVGELLRRADHNLPLEKEGRPDYYLMTSSAAAFGSLFGSPITGVLFGLMFATPDVLRLDALYPCLISSYTAVITAESLGIHRMVIPPYTELVLNPANLMTIMVFALMIGLLARLFLNLLEGFRKAIAEKLGSKALAAIVPAALVMLLFAVIALISGSFSYSGLSIDLLYRAIDGRGVPLYAFMLKAVLVFLSIAAGFAGGEVVPLLVTGGTFGYAFASVFGLETGPYAVLGAIGMLTGGTNLPLVCFALGLELFGYGEPALLFMTVAIAYLSSGNSGIYHHQRIAMQNRIVR